MVKIALKKLPLLGVVFLLSHFFLGWSITWAFSFYDELRLIQLIITILFFIILIFKPKLNLSLINICFLLSIFIILLFQLYEFSIYQYQDLILLIIIVMVPYYLGLELKQDNKLQYLNHSLLFLIIFSSLPVLFITLSINDLFNDRIWHNWQINGGNIRIYDSVIVPIIFLAIYLKSIKYKYISYIYPLIMFLFTLGLWFDGARAALLSVLMGLAVIFIFSKQHRKLTLGTGAIILFSFAVYYSTYYFYNQIYGMDKSLNAIRTNTSGRWELWNYVAQKWVEQPWKGVGGNFLATTNYTLNHLHNFYLKLIFEWGFLGFIFLCWICYQLKKVLISSDVHISVKAGICAVAIDAFFSGNLIYPASQISIALLLGFAFSQYNPNTQCTRKTKYLTKIVILLWFALYIYILGNYFSQDLLCWQCGSHAELMAPGFWYYGKAEHLIHHSLIP